MKQRNPPHDGLLSQRKPFLWRPFWLLVFIILIIGALLWLGLYLFSPEWTHTHQDLPVDLRSPLRADYSADPLHLLRAPLQQSIIAEAVYDQPQPGETPVHVLATLAVNLTAPVPSVTLPAGLARTATPTTTNPVATMTSTPKTPTSTQTVVASASPSVTPLWTVAPFATSLLPSATRTARPPAATPTRRVETPTPTDSPVPSATATSVHLPTHAYPPPATPTATQSSAYPLR